jgi:hypothetical protein
LDAAAGETPHLLLCVVQRTVNRHRAYSIKHFMPSRDIRWFVNFVGVLVEMKIILTKGSLVKFKSLAEYFVCQLILP